MPKVIIPFSLQMLLANAIKKAGFEAKDPCKTFRDFPFSDQVKVFKTMLFDKSNGNVRQSVIDEMYKQVFGRVSSTGDFTYWDHKLTTETTNWYATMINAGIKYLNSQPEECKKMINQAYMDIFGRTATKDDMAYWLPKKEHYYELAKAALLYLYSDAGIKDFGETVNRAFTKKKPSRTDTELKQMLNKARESKYSFNQMVGQIN